MGHGVSLTQLNGRVIADILLNKILSSVALGLSIVVLCLYPDDGLKYHVGRSALGVLKVVDGFTNAA